MAEHIVKSYDEELQHLNNIIARMGGLAEAQLVSAMDAVVKRDGDLAARTVEADSRVDELEHEADAFVIRLLALRQPMASDLREIISALKISSDLERIADYATNVAKRALALVQSPPVRLARSLPRMANLAGSMINDVLDAYVARDAGKALEVWERDEELDEMYTALFRELLTYMMEDARSISPSTHLLFVAKNIERIGDHCTNIAENIYFLVYGEPLLQSRPKGDEAAYTTLEAPEDGGDAKEAAPKKSTKSGKGGAGRDDKEED